MYMALFSSFAGHLAVKFSRQLQGLAPVLHLTGLLHVFYVPKVHQLPPNFGNLSRLSVSPSFESLIPIVIIEEVLDVFLIASLS